MRGMLVLSLLLVSAPPLGELDTVKAEKHRVSVQLLQTQQQLAACQIEAQTRALTADQLALEARFREILQPAAGTVFDWGTLMFINASP